MRRLLEIIGVGVAVALLSVGCATPGVFFEKPIQLRDDFRPHPADLEAFFSTLFPLDEVITFSPNLEMEVKPGTCYQALQTWAAAQDRRGSSGIFVSVQLDSFYGRSIHLGMQGTPKKNKPPLGDLGDSNNPSQHPGVHVTTIDHLFITTANLAVSRVLFRSSFHAGTCRLEGIDYDVFYFSVDHS
jgi:hypothetical protein